MATPYETIYSSFRINKIKDTEILSLKDEDIETLDFGYLKSARVKFKTCSKMSDYDDVLKQFNKDLTDEEVEILANLMIVEWLTPKINATEFLRMNMDATDFKIFSPANQLKQLKEIRDNFKKEANALIGSYSYNNLKDKL